MLQHSEQCQELLFSTLFSILPVLHSLFWLFSLLAESCKLCPVHRGLLTSPSILSDSYKSCHRNDLSKNKQSTLLVLPDSVLHQVHIGFEMKAWSLWLTFQTFIFCPFPAAPVLLTVCTFFQTSNLCASLTTWHSARGTGHQKWISDNPVPSPDLYLKGSCTLLFLSCLVSLLNALLF